jgi:hypothetical protein
MKLNKIGLGAAAGTAALVALGGMGVVSAQAATRTPAASVAPGTSHSEASSPGTDTDPTVNDKADTAGSSESASETASEGAGETAAEAGVSDGNDGGHQDQPGVDVNHVGGADEK